MKSEIGSARRLVLIVDLTGRAASIYHHSYLADLQGRAAVEWMARWGERACTGVPWRILVDTQWMREQVDAAVAGTSACVMFARPQFRLEAWREALTSAGATDLGLLLFGAMFARPTLTFDLWREHTSSGAHYSFVSGLPAGCAPEIFSTEAIDEILELRAQGLMLSVDSVVEAWRRLGGYPSLADEEGPRVYEHDASEAHGSAARPGTITLSDGLDVDVARAVLNETSMTADGELPRGMELWQSHSVRLLAERRRRLIDMNRGGVVVAGLTAPTVLYVANASGYSGGEQALTVSARHVPPERFSQKALVAVEGLQTQRFRASGVDVCVAGQGFIAPTVDNLMFVRGVARNAGARIVHSNSSVGMPTVASACELDIPLVHHQRIVNVEGFGDELAWASAVITVSEYAKGELVRAGVAADKIHVVYDGVDFGLLSAWRCTKSAARAQLGVSESAFLVLCVARFSESKRHDVLLDAFSLLTQRVASAELALVGDSYGEEEVYGGVKKQISAGRMEASVHEFGFVTDIRVAHRAADVLVLCSEREALGVCVLEAMALGVPVVVSEAGGMEEIIGDSRAGLMVKVGDSGALAQALEEVYFEHQHDGGMVRRAYDVVRERFDATSTAKHMMDVWSRVLA